MTTIRSAGADRIGRARRYTAGAAVRDLVRIGGRLPSIWRVWVRKEIDPKLREQVMLAVARANACRYCTFAHLEWALAVGVEEDEVAGMPGFDPDRLDPETRVAIAWALARLEAGFGPVPAALEDELSARHPARRRRDLDTVVRVMTFANLSANTLEALSARLRGAPVADSRIVDELVVGTGFAAVIGPVLLMLSVRRGQPPHRLVRDFKRSVALAESTG